MKTFAFLLGIALVLTLLGCSGSEDYEQQKLEVPSVSSAETININMAGTNELRRIPFIGERLAQEIIEHREKHGPFRKTEHLILLNGISDARFREIRHLVRVN